MLRQNQNILGYLQKKSFFQNPTKKSVSPAQSRFTSQHYHPPPTTQKTQAQTAQKNYSRTPFKTPPRSPTASHNRSVIEYPRKTPLSPKPVKYASKRHFYFDDHHKNLRQEYLNERSIDKDVSRNIHLNTSIDSMPAPIRQRNFQSSKIQSKMCLEDLHHRIAIQLNLVDKIIAEINTSMASIVYAQLNQLKMDIARVVEEIFCQARMQLEDKIQHSKNEHLKQFLQIKYNLKEKQNILRQMKYQMEVNWRKVAGEMLTNQTDRYIQNTIENSTILRAKFHLNQPNTPSLNPRLHKLQPLKQIIKDMINKLT